MLRDGFNGGWPEVWMYKLDTADRDYIFYRNHRQPHRHEPIPLLGRPSTPVCSYAAEMMMKDKDPILKFWIDFIAEKEPVELTMGSWALAAHYGITISRLSDPRITDSKAYGNTEKTYGKLTQLPAATSEAITFQFVTELFEGSETDAVGVFLAVHRQNEIDWEDLGKQMEHPFVWYDFQQGTSSIYRVGKRWNTISTGTC